MSVEPASMGVHKYERRYKGALLTIFLSLLAFTSAGLALVLTNDVVIDDAARITDARIVSSGGSAIGDLLALPAIVVSALLSLLTVIISINRLRHYKSSRKALLNIVTLIFGVVTTFIAYKVSQQI